MKSTNKRERAKIGKTDYYHRKKIICNYPEVTRIRFGKKLNYYYMGIYNTISPDQPDQCLYYAESRMMRDKSTLLPAKTNTTTAYFFGKLVASKINELQVKKILTLDLGRRKHIVYKSFLFGVISQLSTQMNQKLKHGFNVEQIKEYQNSIVGDYEFTPKKIVKDESI